MRIFSPGWEGCTGVRLSCWAQLAILPREINYNMDKSSKVKVYGEDVYFNFGVRFAAVIQEVIQENNGKQTEE